jgi:hypothetical protein
MSGKRLILVLTVVAVVGAVTFTTQAAPRLAARAGPQLLPVAETRLLMEGLALANFRGLEKILKEKPADKQAWTFARGQALLIAETGNLLMIRPPHNKGEKLWLDRADKLRSAASRLARTLAKRDFTASRKGLADVAARCNACHQTFRVDVQINPFAKAENKDNDNNDPEVNENKNNEPEMQIPDSRLRSSS